MKIVLLLTGELGINILSFLIEQGENIAGIVTIKNQQDSFNKKIRDLCLESSLLLKEIDGNEDISGFLKEMKADFILSVYWPYILKKEIIEMPKDGIINFHLSYIPYNRGSNPNIWPIIDNTPAGVTIHFIDEDIDSGAIVCQEKVEVEITDTAGTLFRKLIYQMTKMFKSEWSDIKNKKFKLIKPDLSKGNIHFKKQFKDLDEIKLHEETTALKLINHLRAKTFEGQNGVFFTYMGKRVFVKIELEEE
jgi:methionyl-tRNA formyltransferase